MDIFPQKDGLEYVHLLYVFVIFPIKLGFYELSLALTFSKLLWPSFAIGIFISL